jgi:tetratricopeptide (TPR) repeat protein
MNRFREAIDLAVVAGDKEALASPLYGAATVLYARGLYKEAINEMERLEVLLGCLSLPDLQAASRLLKAMILRKQGEIDPALVAAWSAYDSLKLNPQLVLYPHILCVIGQLHHLKGDTAAARLYLDLADRSLKRTEFPRIARLLDEALAQVGTSRISKMDLVFDSRSGILTERLKGEIRFEGQFILRDLLKLLLENPGRIFSKEDLVRLVWRDSYRPETHDNKIYVTIKRLRKLIEDETTGTEYIMRAKNGYLLNPKTRVLIEDNKAIAEKDK